MRGSIDASRRSFRTRWWIANAAGFTMAHVVYSLVGHGFTGSHGDQLTSAQYAAHTLSSAVTIVAFWGGLGTAAAVMFVLIRGGIFYPDSETLFNHTVFWVVLGGVTGAAGGYFSAWPLSRVVIAADAAQQAV
jgi:hypothetical protein